MVLRLDDHWVWDLWTARDDEGTTHLFFLHAPKTLGEEGRRHHAARIGRATSTDLRTWALQPRPLADGPRGGDDDLATWTGSVVRDDDGTWHLFYTGASTAEDGRVQRVLSATSSDLVRWTRTDVLVEADPARYETREGGAPETHWRDPWVFRLDGTWHMLVTARVDAGPDLRRGVLGHATSPDLRAWTVHDPFLRPDGFRQLEVPQRVRLGDRWVLIGCANDTDLDPDVHDPATGAGAATGTYAWTTDDPAGMTGWVPTGLLLGGSGAPYYAARVVEAPEGPALLAWRSWDGDTFVGEVADPIPVRLDADGRPTAGQPVPPPPPAAPRPHPTAAEIRVDPATARVYEHGWQSWTPAGTYRLGDRPPRPVSPIRWRGNYRGDVHAVPGVFQGDGLLAIDPGDGSGIHVLSTAHDAEDQPTIRAEQVGDRLVVTADHPVEHRTIAADDLHAALALHADDVAVAAGARLLADPPTIWCTWYHYFTEVTAADVTENLAAIDREGLAVDVVQVDDGYQAEIGDWLDPHPRFGPLGPVAAAIHGTGRASGIWVAPFLVAPRSRLAREHPEWLVGDLDAGWNWGQHMLCLDVTHPAAAEHLAGTFRRLRDLGITFFKLDFLYAGALPGRRHGDASPLAAYLHGLDLIRGAVGEDALLQGCGAPLLPSVGRVDLMRVGPDIAVRHDPEDGDLSQPSQRAATLTSDQRRWMDRRLWRNDPDCLVVRPEVEQRERWAAFLFGYAGLRGASDRIAALDPWGLEVTRAFLAGGTTPPSPPLP